MKILLVSQWYPPEPVKYISELTETLVALGQQVSVLTAFPNWPYGKVFEGYRQQLFFKETMNGVTVHRAPLFPDHSDSGFARAVNSASFSASATFVAISRMERHDAILSLTPSLSVFGPSYVLARKWRAPMVLNVQDMWPEALEAAGLVRSKAALAAVAAVCDAVYRRTKKIIVISEGFKKNLILKGVPEEKIEVISNWVDTDEFKPMQKDEDLAERLGLRGKFNFIFAGTMGPSQDLMSVVEAANILRESRRIQIVLVGDGNEKPKLMDRCDQLGLENVKFLGRIAESEIKNVLALADVLLVHLKDNPILRITVPHKTHVYMSTGKPILAAIDGDTKELIEAARAGVTCAPSHAEQIASAMRRMSEMSTEELEELGRNGRTTACAKLNKERLVKRYLETLRGV